MTRHNMGIILIILGVVILGVGIFMVASKAGEEHPVQVPAAPQVQVVVVEKPVQQPQQQSQPELPQASTPELPATETAEPVETNQDSYEIGAAFEDFIVNLLADWRFKLLERTQDAVSSKGVFAESCKNPDLHIKQKRNNQRDVDYYLECKYRSKWFNGAIELENWQLDRYRTFQGKQRRKVLFALGVGGTPSAPETVMIVPLDSVKNNTIKRTDTKFAIDPTPTNLASYIDTYFTTVFTKPKIQ